MARPREYKKEYIKKVDEYLLTCGDKVDEYHKTRGDRSNTFERIVNVNLPKIEGFAQYINVSKNTLYEWAKIYPLFSDALDKIMVAQHNMLADGGVSGRYNPVITKLMLSHNHSYREKTDMTTDGKELPQPILLNVPSYNSDKEDTSATQEN